MITSVHNEQVKQVVSLHQTKGRKEYNQFIIEGKRFVKEALLRGTQVKKIYYKQVNNRQDLEIESLIALAQEQGFETEEVTEIVMKKMSATEEPQGILAVIEKPKFDWTDVVIDDTTILLIIDGLQDPGNVGTILRTALAADVKHIILTRGSVDIYNPKVLRSSMGAVFSQIVVAEKSPEDIVNFCKEKGCTLTVSTMEGDSIFAEEASELYPFALVIGNEAIGPNVTFIKHAKKNYAIPMFNKVESLNAAMAAGIFLYEMRRQGQFL